MRGRGEDIVFDRKPTKVGALFMVLIVALAVVGVGSALWSKVLYIEGTVATGNVDAELSFFDAFEPEEKDVGTCEGRLGDTNQENDTLFVEIGNAYPSYECWLTFDVHNIGTIPIHIHQPVFDLTGLGDVVEFDVLECYPQDWQLHTEQFALCTLRVHILQEAEQGADYTFSGTVFVHQYNEEAAG